MTDTRIVLIKPGDVLVIGNLGRDYDYTDDAHAHLLDGLSALKESLHLAGIVVFAEDIDLAAVRAALLLPPEQAAPGDTE